jgi:fucose 4-O-acetylase-like acetyltransferase
MTLIAFFDILSVVSGLIPVAAALFNYKNLDGTLKVVAVFVIVSSLFDLLLELMVRLGVRNNLPLIHLFILLSVILFGAIYYRAFFNPILKKTVIVLCAITAAINLFNVIFVEGIWEYPSISNTVTGILLIFISLAYFYQLLNRAEFVHIEKQGMFWVNSGVLFYYSLALFLFMLYKQITKAHFGEYYMIHNVINIIANLLYTAGLLCKPQKA